MSDYNPPHETITSIIDINKVLRRIQEHDIEGDHCVTFFSIPCSCVVFIAHRLFTRLKTKFCTFVTMFRFFCSTSFKHIFQDNKFLALFLFFRFCYLKAWPTYLKACCKSHVFVQLSTCLNIFITAVSSPLNHRLFRKLSVLVTSHVSFLKYNLLQN